MYLLVRVCRYDLVDLTLSSWACISQLEEQRLYYERLLARVEEGESRQLLNAHEHERKHLKKANAALAEKAKKLEEELTFVRWVC